MTITSDYPAVEVFCKPCPTSKQSIAACREIRCCWAFARHGQEQRLADDARIAAEKAREGKVAG